jgi:hypothetical protein
MLPCGNIAVVWLRQLKFGKSLTRVIQIQFQGVPDVDPRVVKYGCVRPPNLGNTLQDLAAAPNAGLQDFHFIGYMKHAICTGI